MTVLRSFTSDEDRPDHGAFLIRDSTRPEQRDRDPRLDEDPAGRPSVCGGFAVAGNGRQRPAVRRRLGCVRPGAARAARQRSGPRVLWLPDDDAAVPGPAPDGQYVREDAHTVLLHTQMYRGGSQAVRLNTSTGGVERVRVEGVEPNLRCVFAEPLAADLASAV